MIRVAQTAPRLHPLHRVRPPLRLCLGSGLGWISGAPGKFSIRGGFGIYYDRSEEETSLQTLGTPPFGFTSAGAGDFAGRHTLANPYADINGGFKQSAAGRAERSRKVSQPNRFPYVPPSAGSSPLTSPSKRITLILSTNTPPASALLTLRTFSSQWSANSQRRSSRARATSVRSVGTTRPSLKEIPITPAGQAACFGRQDLQHDQPQQPEQALSHPHSVFGYADPGHWHQRLYEYRAHLDQCRVKLQLASAQQI